MEEGVEITSEEDLLKLLNKLIYRRHKDKPSHLVMLEFKSAPVSNFQIEEFVRSIQSRLNTLKLGVLDIYGIDEDGTGGRFFIKCPDHEDGRKAFDQIKPILDITAFFVNGRAKVKLLAEDGSYYSEDVEINPNFEAEIEDNDPDLPLPEGVPDYSNGKSGGGCLGPLLVVLTMVLIWHLI